MDKTCKNCTFWDQSEDWGDEDEWEGTCRRIDIPQRDYPNSARLGDPLEPAPIITGEGFGCTLFQWRVGRER
mgnify:CR=1 FL=1